MRYKLGITAGDPAGIGMEVVLKALNHRGIYDRCVPLVIGDKAAAEDAIKISGLSFTLRCVNSPEETRGEYGTIDLLDMALLGARGEGESGGWNYGAISRTAGDAAFRYVERAITLAMDKRIDAVVNAPINKEAINLAGHRYAGHTEILSEMTGSKDYAMLLACGDLRVIHVTSHVSLRQAAERVTTERVLAVIRLAWRGLTQLGRQNPRIAVAGFNPHASEGGLFGDEEARAIIPAVAAAKAEGIDVTGPLPPDTVFVKALGGQFDVVVAMYHDQGHIPLKLVGFKLGAAGKESSVSGINCTLGLPIIRTSVDHGTAFDRAGKNCSSEQSMLDAIEAACTMAANRTAGESNEF